jgi:hypothetical protein
MGLLDMLTKGWTKNPNGSAYAAMPNGATPPTNPLSTKQSNLHYNVAANGMGYSTVGAQSIAVTNEYNKYNDGVINNIPFPSLLDFDDVLNTSLYGSKKGNNTYISRLNPNENPGRVTE